VWIIRQGEQLVYTRFFISFLIGGFVMAAGADTLQERLGYGPDARVLLIHADDAGMCHSENMATIEAMEKGVVSTASIMMPCPWVPEIVKYCVDHPEADFGLHLTLNCEWHGYRWSSVAPKNQVPGLLDPTGYLWGRVEEVATHATPQEVECEIRAQVESALKMGLKPTHIDTHMGTIYARKEFLEAAMKVAEEYGIPFMLLEPTPQVIERWGDRNFLKEEFIQEVRASGAPLLTTLYSSYEHKSIEETRKEYCDIIRNLPVGVSQLIVHVGKEDEELKAVTGNWKIRSNDLAIMLDPELRRVIDESGVKLIGWRPLQEAWLKVKK
jgi:hypothetical protein